MEKLQLLDSPQTRSEKQDEWKSIHMAHCISHLPQRFLPLALPMHLFFNLLKAFLSPSVSWLLPDFMTCRVRGHFNAWRVQKVVLKKTLTSTCSFVYMARCCAIVTLNSGSRVATQWIYPRTTLLVEPHRLMPADSTKTDLEEGVDTSRLWAQLKWTMPVGQVKSPVCGIPGPLWGDEVTNYHHLFYIRMSTVILAGL